MGELCWENFGFQNLQTGPALVEIGLASAEIIFYPFYQMAFAGSFSQCIHSKQKRHTFSGYPYPKVSKVTLQLTISIG